MIDAKALFEKFEDEFLKFDRVQNPECGSPDICAFLRIDRMLPTSDGSDMVTCAEHDQIWLRPDIESFNGVATEDDVLFLARCGVFFDNDVDSLSMFV